MTTKKDKLFLKKQFSETNDSHRNKNNCQFFNLNLNQSQKCSENILPFHSSSKSNNDKIFDNTFSKRHHEKGKTFNKSTKNINSNFEIKKEKENQKRWMKEKDCSKNINKSTLSLHIAAYENSIVSNNEIENLQKESKVINFGDSDSKFQDSFEFPRQMKGNESKKPEIQQFKASQKLFVPYQGASSSQMQPLLSFDRHASLKKTSKEAVTMSKRPLLFTASYDETIRMWDVVNERQLEQIAVKDTQTNALSITPDGHQLAAACYQTLRLFDCGHLGNQPLQVFNVHERNVTCMGFSHDGAWIYTGSEDQTAKIWDLRSNTLVCQRILQLNSTVNSIALHPKSHVELIVADSAGGIFLWDIRTNRDDSLQTELSYTEFVTKLDIDKFGKHVAAITNKGNCFVYSMHSESMLGPDHLYGETELNPDPFGAAPSPIHYQHDSRPKPIIFKPHKQYGLSCKFLPNGSGFVTTAGDELPQIWDISPKDENGEIKLRQTFQGELKRGRRTPDADNHVNMKWIWDVAFTNDSTKMFTAGTDHVMRLFDVNNGQLLRRYQGHSKGITCMAFWEPS